MEKINIVKCVRTCTSCPSQWDMYDDQGIRYYVRYRWGNLTVSYEPLGELLFEKICGHEFDGYMSEDSLVLNIGNMFSFTDCVWLVGRYE